jgi:hypothetical protein
MGNDIGMYRLSICMCYIRAYSSLVKKNMRIFFSFGILNFMKVMLYLHNFMKVMLYLHNFMKVMLYLHNFMKVMLYLQNFIRVFA